MNTKWYHKPSRLLAAIAWASFFILVWLLILDHVNGLVPGLSLILFFLIALAASNWGKPV